MLHPSKPIVSWKHHQLKWTQCTSPTEHHHLAQSTFNVLIPNPWKLRLTSARWLDPSPGLHAGNSSHFCFVWSVAQCFFDPILCTEFFQFASLEWIGIEWLYYQQCNDFSVGEPITDPELDKTPPLITAAKETIRALIQSRSRSDSLQPALSWVLTHF